MVIMLNILIGTILFALIAVSARDAALRVAGQPGTCLAILLPDGLANKCFLYDGEMFQLEPESLQRGDSLALIYDEQDFRIVDLTRIDASDMKELVNNGRQTTGISDHVSITFPRGGEALTSSVVDVHL